METLAPSSCRDPDHMVVCSRGVYRNAGASPGLNITPVFFGWALLNRNLLGFVIGISMLAPPWGVAWHGDGRSRGLSLCLFDVDAGESRRDRPWGLGRQHDFWPGIEFLTTVAFKQPQQAPAATAGEMDPLAICRLE
jgi:hypothetical protein